MVADFLEVAVFADGSEKIGRLEELRLRDAGDALDDFRRVSRIVLLQKLENASRMLERQIVRDDWRRAAAGAPAAGAVWAGRSISRCRLPDTSPPSW